MNEILEQLSQLSEEEREILLSGMSDEDREAIADAQEKAKQDQIDTLEALGRSIAERRAEAISGRLNSGIESEWTEDEEFYEGIDDANRGENKTAWQSKPPGEVSPGGDDDTSSTIFLNITRPYCDAAGASLADMLLPTDDNSWQISNTPVPEFIPISKGEIPEDMRSEMLADAGGDPEQAKAIEAKVIAQAVAELEKAKTKADAAQKRIEDWHVESQYHAEVRQVIEDAARIGSGVLKGPFPERRRHVAFMDGELVVSEEIKPVSRRINYWNLYPDPAGGENIHDGSYLFEKDDITDKRLRELIGVPGYLEGQIKECLEEGPLEADKEFKSAEEMKSRDTKTLFEIWYFYGDIKKEDMEAAGCECEEDIIHAQIVMVNNRVIKAAMNPLDTGEFPFDIMVWQRRRGMPWGMGVSRQIRTPQRMINGGGRNLMDNAGLAGGPMWAFNQGVVEPIDGVASIAPRKGWVAAEDAGQEDISRAFTYFTMPVMTQELMTIINLGLKMAEDVTGLPMIMQGQMGSQNVDTLGQTQILNNNANIVRRRLARSFDDTITEPHIRRYYTYLLQFGEDEEKGEFVIDAKGSSNLVERAIQKEQTIKLLEMSTNPVFGIDPKKAIKEYLRSEKFDPKNFEYDDEEWQQIVQNLAQPQEVDPRAEVAQLNAEVRQIVSQQEIESKERVKAAELQSKERMQDKDHQFDAAMEQFAAAIDKEAQAGRYQGDKDMLLDKLKVQINDTVMKLSTQKQLSAIGARAKNMPKPPTEPAGRAKPGESYQR